MDMYVITKTVVGKGLGLFIVIACIKLLYNKYIQSLVKSLGDRPFRTACFTKTFGE